MRSPPGTKIVFVGGDRMTSELTVPLSQPGAVAPGGEVDVAVDLVAPSELGRYLGYWRLTGPYGRRKFGQRVWCHVQVVDPSKPVDTLEVEDLQATLDEIKRKKDSLAATEDAEPKGAELKIPVDGPLQCEPAPKNPVKKT